MDSKLTFQAIVKYLMGIIMVFKAPVLLRKRLKGWKDTLSTNRK